MESAPTVLSENTRGVGFSSVQGASNSFQAKWMLLQTYNYSVNVDGAQKH